MVVPVVYHPDYFSDIGVHVFPAEKFAMVLDGISRHLDDPQAAVHVPDSATAEQLLRVHTREYLDDLDTCRQTPRTMFSELPLTREIVDAYYVMADGTCLAAELALEHGAAMNLGDRAEGFCYINDVTVAVRDAKAQGRIERVAVVDTDLHQGNHIAVELRLGWIGPRFQHSIGFN